MTSGEVTVETGKSQFIFYPPILVHNLLMSNSWSSPLLLSFLDVGPWAYMSAALANDVAVAYTRIDSAAPR
jgi:hypothetical protein